MSQLENMTGIYKCSACGESFDSLPELREHEKDCIQQAAPQPQSRIHSFDQQRCSEAA